MKRTRPQRGGIAPAPPSNVGERKSYNLQVAAAGDNQASLATNDACFLFRARVSKTSVVGLRSRTTESDPLGSHPLGPPTHPNSSPKSRLSHRKESGKRDTRTFS